MAFCLKKMRQQRQFEYMFVKVYFRSSAMVNGSILYGPDIEQYLQFSIPDYRKDVEIVFAEIPEMNLEDMEF